MAPDAVEAEPLPDGDAALHDADLMATVSVISSNSIDGGVSPEYRTMDTFGIDPKGKVLRVTIGWTPWNSNGRSFAGCDSADNGMVSSTVGGGGDVPSVGNAHFLLSAETVTAHTAMISAATVKNLVTNVIVDGIFISYSSI